MNKAEVAKLLTVIKIAYPNFEVSESVVNLWYVMLKEMPFAKAERNLREHITKSKFPPTIAEVVRYDPFEDIKDLAIAEFTKRGFKAGETPDDIDLDADTDEGPHALPEPWIEQIH